MSKLGRPRKYDKPLYFGMKVKLEEKEAIKKVKEGDSQIAFIMNPTKIHQIKNVALKGLRMPQKSTFFYPKLLTGLVMNLFEE